MALSLRGVAESTAAADPTITHPGGIAQNDVVIFAVHTDETSNQDLSMITTGYTELADVYANDNFDTNLGVFRKIMGATPDSSAQAETGSATGLAVEHVWTGADTTTPEDATTTTVTKTNGSRADPPAITTVTADAVVIAICSSAYQQTGTLSEPTGYSNLVDVGESVTGHVMMASKAKASPGAEDPGIFNGFNNGVSDSAASGAAATVALRPGTSGAYTLSLATVAWTRSVTAVALERGREIVPASVSWARTVTDVTFTKGKTLAPDTVAWARSLQTVSLEHGREIVPASVSWARSVTDVALEKGYEIAPATVSWARSLDAVLLELGREIVPEGVAWARSVTDVTFTLLADKAIVPDTVAWSRSVQDAALEQGREIIPDTVAWSRGVADVALEFGHEIVPDTVAWARDIDDITFTYVPGAGVVEVADTHDGGAAPRKRRNNFQPLPSLEEVRRRLLSRTKRPVDEIEEAAEQIEALAEQIDEPAAPWVNPVPLPERSDAAKTLALLAQEARRIQSVLEHVQSVARQRALERYRESVRVLEAAMRERQEAEEADEIVQIIAQIM